MYSPPGTMIGRVQQEWSIIYPKFTIRNANDETILRIDGPFCTFNCCCGDVTFNVKSSTSDDIVGTISKQWSGAFKEMLTDADNFNITFPLDLDVNVKAVLLGALFLIVSIFIFLIYLSIPIFIEGDFLPQDMMYFEHSK